MSLLHKREDNYPTNQIVMLDIPIIPKDEVKDFIVEKVFNHKFVETAKEDKDLPNCTKEERWAKPDVWAIMKNGNKRASKLTYSAEAAEIALNTAGKGHSIEVREGESVRCERYCSVKEFCNQYKRMKNG